MATSAGEIEVILSLVGKEFNESLKRIEDKLAKTETTAKKFGSTLAGIFSAKQIFDFGKAAFTAFGEQEAAIVKLNQAMANMGIYTKDASKDLLDFASAMQETTVFADEQITSMQAQLVAFGLQGDQLKQVTKATLDLASAKGIDLASAAQLLGKAFVGETGTLARYGIVLDDSIPKSEKFAAVLDKVNGMFGGQAAKERQTALGQLKAMQNTYGELLETIGALIAGPATSFMKWISGVVKNLDVAIQTIRAASSEAGGFFNVILQTAIYVITQIVRAYTSAYGFIVGKIFEFLGMVPGLQTAFAAIGLNIDTLKLKAETAFAGVDTWIESQGHKVQVLAQRWVTSGSKVIASEQAKAEAVIEYNNVAVASTTQRMVTEAEMQAAMYAGFLENQEARLVALNDFLGLSANAWTDFHKIMQNATQQTFDAFGKAMADVIVDSKSFSEALRGIWKSLIKSLISEIIALIAKLIVALALKSALGLGGATMAEVARNVLGLQRLSGKGGMATGGIINEPSIVTGLKSGKSHMIGEAGAEAVIPMSGAGGNKSAQEMGMDFTGAMNGGGVNLTVNITGQFIEGDETAWGRMFREKILPEIKRATMTNPTGNFIRRRGATA